VAIIHSLIIIIRAHITVALTRSGTLGLMYGDGIMFRHRGIEGTAVIGGLDRDDAG
jgi:hypothetical protein